jgi:hypothetical protein
MVTPFGAWATGFLTAAVLSTLAAVLVILLAAPFLWQGWWLALTIAAMLTSTFAGGVLGLCACEYGQVRRTVDLQCRPVREVSAR